MIAAKAGDKEELERTVDEGVDVDYQNEVMRKCGMQFCLKKRGMDFRMRERGD